MDLRRTLNPGDLVELRISRIGSLINRIGAPQNPIESRPRDHLL
jgi:hypothetical protein